MQETQKNFSDNFAALSINRSIVTLMQEVKTVVKEKCWIIDINQFDYQFFFFGTIRILMQGTKLEHFQLNHDLLV